MPPAPKAFWFGPYGLPVFWNASNDQCSVKEGYRYQYRVGPISAMTVFDNIEGSS